MRGIATVLPHSAQDAYTQRVLVITSASLSIVSGIGVLIWWYIVPIIHNKRYKKKKKRIRQFRHDLTLALITIDLIKAIVIITYPIRFLHDHQLSPTEVYNTFCDVIGFFTVATMQASDFAVLALAIHTALLVFRPDYTGGLYRFRYYIYTIFFVAIPLVFASLGMVQHSGYTFFSSWCYLVVRPLWYSLVLSWIPRFFIMFTIIVIYSAIFIYIKTRLYSLSKTILQSTQVQNFDKEHSTNPQTEQSGKITFLGSIQHVFWKSRHAPYKIWRIFCIGVSYLPWLSGLNPILKERLRQSSKSSTLINPTNSGTITSPADSIARTSTITEEFQAQLNRKNVERFNRRRHIIERQVNSIFIYPMAYMILYIFPLVQQCLYYMDNVEHKLEREPVFWLALVASWMKPFNCCVNTLVFVIREGAIPCIGPQRHRKKLYNAGDDLDERPSFAQGLTDEEQYYSGGDVEIDYVIRSRENSVSPSTKTDLWHKFKALFSSRDPSERNTTVIRKSPMLSPQEQVSPSLLSKASRTNFGDSSTQGDGNPRTSLDWSHITWSPEMPKRTMSIPARTPPISGLKRMATINTGELSTRRNGSSSNQSSNNIYYSNHGSDDSNDNNDSNDFDNDEEMDLKEFLAHFG